jgi:hypothetical protein
MGEGIAMGRGDEGYRNDTVIHYSERFPVVRTACGTKAPSTGEWRFVSCEICIELRVGLREVEDERHGPIISSARPQPSMMSAAKRR